MITESLRVNISLLIVGAIVGASATGIVTQVQNFVQKRQQASSLRAAFAGEVSALVEIAQGLKMIQDVEKAAELMRRTKEIKPLELSVKQDYFYIYRANVANLGILKANQVRKLCTFYTYCFATIEYLNELSTIDWAKATTLEEALQDLARLSRLLNEVHSRGNEIVQELQA